MISIYAPGHWDMYDSYGLLACQLARHFEAAGEYVSAIALGDREVDNQPEDVKRITKRPVSLGFGGILLGYPTTYASYPACAHYGPRIALTMFESTKLPDEWAPILNQMSAVVVPSQFCASVFRKEGVRVPIYVVPLGIDEVYKPVLRKPKEVLTFLTFLDRGRRKGGYHAMQAFLKAFQDDTHYKLIVKTRRPTELKVNILNDNIEMVQADMSVDELYALYLSTDVLINPNLGEGFGLIPREYAATGGVALATNWGGTAEDIQEWGIPLEYTLTPAWKGHEKHEGLGCWAEPNIDHVTHVLRSIAKYPGAYFKDAYINAQSLHALYAWDAFAVNILGIWKEVQHAYRTANRAFA